MKLKYSKWHDAYYWEDYDHNRSRLFDTKEDALWSLQNEYLIMIKGYKHGRKRYY